MKGLFFIAMLASVSMAQEKEGAQKPDILLSGGGNGGNHGNDWQVNIVEGRTFAIYLLQTAKPNLLAPGTTAVVRDQYLDLRRDLAGELVLAEGNYKFTDLDNSRKGCGQTGTNRGDEIVFSAVRCVGYDRNAAARVWITEAGHHMGLNDTDAGAIAGAVVNGYTTHANKFPVVALEGDYLWEHASVGTLEFSIRDFDYLEGPKLTNNGGWLKRNYRVQVRNSETSKGYEWVLEHKVYTQTFGYSASDTIERDYYLELFPLGQDKYATTYMWPVFRDLYDWVRVNTPKPWVAADYDRKYMGTIIKKPWDRNFYIKRILSVTENESEFLRFFDRPLSNTDWQSIIEQQRGLLAGFLSKMIGKNSSYDYKDLFENLRKKSYPEDFLVESLFYADTSAKNAGMNQYILDFIQAPSTADAIKGLFSRMYLERIIASNNLKTLDAVIKDLNPLIDLCSSETFPRTSSKNLLWKIFENRNVSTAQVQNLMANGTIKKCLGQNKDVSDDLVSQLYVSRAKETNSDAGIILESLIQLGAIVDKAYLSKDFKGNIFLGLIMNTMRSYQPIVFDRSFFDVLSKYLKPADIVNMTTRMGQSALDFLMFYQAQYPVYCGGFEKHEKQEVRDFYANNLKAIHQFGRYVIDDLKLDWKRSAFVYYDWMEKGKTCQLVGPNMNNPMLNPLFNFDGTGIQF